MDNLWRRLDPLIRAGRSIEAIKSYRDEKKVDLREAKRAVEARIEHIFPPRKSK